MLSKTAVVIYSVFLILVNSFGGLIGIPQTYATEITSSSIVDLANQARTLYGLNTLSNNAKLEAAALAKANNMFELQYWDHFGPNGESPWQFIRGAGYNYVYAGENLARGFRTAEGVHEAWMASPTHKANIVSPNYEDIGVSVVTGVLEGSQTILVVQMFGSLSMPSTSVPSTVTDTEDDEETYVPTESGQIKSIMITSPKTDDLLNDPSTNIKGEVSNITEDYQVEIYDNDESAGTTDVIDSDTSQWEFNKNSDWSEGKHSVKAKISGTSTESDTVSFTIDSNPPEIDKESISVQHNDSSFSVSFSVNEDIGDAILVTGDQSFNLEKNEEGNMVADISQEDIGDSVQLVVADVLGNSTAVDVSEYFIDETEEENVRINFAGFLRGVDTTDKINLVIAFVIFTLLCVEVYVYWKKNRLRNISNDLFALGFWWLLLVVGITTGFAGFVN